ncbi:hypothetical protein BOTCAL_0015g00460 [Botryotinia calthae]|uniref:Uncharacterized protein n=1 Tax=Botryotinia calthae TaxID=38488 RepID=A0A4Y8DHW7_9HELO|nr:hypothetical protein BOTCAL_0015g00460 [Botryotinia calthae]
MTIYNLAGKGQRTTTSGCRIGQRYWSKDEAVYISACPRDQKNQNASSWTASMEDLGGIIARSVEVIGTHHQTRFYGGYNTFQTAIIPTSRITEHNLFAKYPATSVKLSLYTDHPLTLEKISTLVDETWFNMDAHAGRFQLPDQEKGLFVRAEHLLADVVIKATTGTL